MPVYLIALTEPSPLVLKNIAKEWPGQYYKITDTLIMISPAASAATSAMKEQVGIHVGEEGPCGLVVKIPESDVSGVLPTAAAKWFFNARDS